MQKRSDSSKAFRARLKKDYVIVPQISAAVAIDRYLAIANNVKQEAQSLVAKRQLPRAYIDFNKFFELIIKIQTHPAYKKRPDVMRWVNVESKVAFELLEDIVRQMDEAQDRFLEEDMDRRLQAEFDDKEGEEGESIAKHSLHLIQSSAPVLPMTVEATSSSNEDKESPYEQRQRRLEILSPQYDFVDRNNPSATAIDYESIESSLSDQAYPVLASLGAVYDEVASSPTILPSSSIKTSNAPVSTVFGQVAEPTAFSQSMTIDLRPFLASSSREDLLILQYLLQSPHFHIPQPATQDVDIHLEPHTTVFQAIQDDFHMSFLGFLQTIIPAELQASRCAIETNRCFYLHLGIATGLHPYLLQTAFRAQATALLNNASADCWYSDLLKSVLDYAGFVDANALCLLWPKEMDLYRVLFVSGSMKPIFSAFTAPGLSAEEKEQLTEVIIHCSGSHFTLLRPRNTTAGGPYRVISKLLTEGRRLGLIVQENEVLQVEVEGSRRLEKQSVRQIAVDIVRQVQL